MASRCVFKNTMNDKLHFLSLGLCILMLSCASPLEPDTPRNRYEDIPSTNTGRLKGHLFQIDVLENQRIWAVSIVDTTIQIDTSTSSFSLWYDSRLVGSSGSPLNTSHLSSFAWHIDSVQLSQAGQTIVDFAHARHWITFVISSSHDSGVTFNHDTLTVNPATGQATMLFLDNSGQRQVTANLNAHLVRYRMTVTGTFIFTY